MRMQRCTARLSTLVIILLAVVALPGSQLASSASSDSGSASVEVLPPGGLAPTPDLQVGYVYIPPGTLTARFLSLPDPGPEETVVDGVFMVEDHRPTAVGWTIHLSDDRDLSKFLGRVVVGAEGWGVSGWVYEGVHTWDSATGMLLADAPPLLTASEGAGHGVTFSYAEIAVDPSSADANGILGQLYVVIPAAP